MLLKFEIESRCRQNTFLAIKRDGGKKVYLNYLADPGASSSPVRPTCKWHNVVTFNEHMKGPD